MILYHFHAPLSTPFRDFSARWQKRRSSRCDTDRGSMIRRAVWTAGAGDGRSAPGRRGRRRNTVDAPRQWDRNTFGGAFTPGLFPFSALSHRSHRAPSPLSDFWSFVPRRVVTLPLSRLRVPDQPDRRRGYYHRLINKPADRKHEYVIKEHRRRGEQDRHPDMPRLPE